jgi:hypothetical protein
LPTGKEWTLPFGGDWVHFPNEHMSTTIEPGEADSSGWKRYSRFPGLNYGGMLSSDGKTIAVLLGNFPLNPDWLSRLLDDIGINVSNGGHVPSGVKLFDTSNEAELAYFPDAHCAAFSHDGKTLAVANGKGQIEVWDLPVGRPPRLVFMLLTGAAALLPFAATRWRNRRRDVTKLPIALVLPLHQPHPLKQKMGQGELSRDIHAGTLSG